MLHTGVATSRAKYLSRFCYKLPSNYRYDKSKSSRIVPYYCIWDSSIVNNVYMRSILNLFSSSTTARTAKKAKIPWFVVHKVVTMEALINLWSSVTTRETCWNLRHVWRRPCWAWNSKQFRKYRNHSSQASWTNNEFQQSSRFVECSRCLLVKSTRPSLVNNNKKRKHGRSRSQAFTF